MGTNVRDIVSYEYADINIKLRKFAARLLRDQGKNDFNNYDIDDLVQQTIMKALEWGGNIENTNTIKLFFKIMFNLFLLARTRGERNFMGGVKNGKRNKCIEDFVSDESRGWEEIFSAHQSSQDDILYVKEIEKIINTLSEKKRDALLLAAIGYTPTEQAKLAGTTCKIIDSRLARGRRELNEAIGVPTRQKKQPKSKFRGVDYSDNRWRVKLRINGKSFYIGRFINEVDAAKAADDAQIKIRGVAEARKYLNFP